MHFSRLPQFILAVLLIALLLPSGAAAEAGILEINQTCAVETGCFSGDDPGFPVTIRSSSGSHSFALTSDVTVASNQTTAISISRTNVTLDLRGFEIACRQPPFNLPCTPNSDGAEYAGGDGVNVIASGVDGVEVRNGTIHAMGDDGLELGPRATVRNVRAIANGGVGIGAGGYAEIRDCHSTENGDQGIYIRGFNGRAMGNSVTLNGSTGIRFTLEGLQAVVGYAADNHVVGNGNEITGGTVGPGNYCGSPLGNFGC